MATITSSSFALGHAQRNEARYVTETHVWDTGERTVLEYGPIHTDKVDLQAIADARARQIETDRAAAEAERQDRAAVEQKLATVLDDAVKAGTVTDEELAKLGMLDVKRKAEGAK